MGTNTAIVSVQVFDNREEWLAHRGIGASEVGAILGLPGYLKPWDVYARHKLGFVAPETEAMTQGRMWEEAFLSYYEKVTNQHAVTPATLDEQAWTCVMENEPWATCSPDGLVVSKKELARISRRAIDVVSGDVVAIETERGVEAKRSRVYKNWGEPGDILPGAETIPMPEANYIQCLWSLAVTGLPYWDLIAVVYGEDKIYRIHADTKRQAALVAKVKAWYQRYIVGDEVPELDGSAGADFWLRESFPIGEGTRTASEDEEKDAVEYNRMGEEIKVLDAKRKVISQRILASAGDLAGLTLTNGKVTIVRSAGAVRVDTKLLLAKFPEVYEQVTKLGAGFHYPKITLKGEE